MIFFIGYLAGVGSCLVFWAVCYLAARLVGSGRYFESE
jgi:hypothetical protein